VNKRAAPLREAAPAQHIIKLALPAQMVQLTLQSLAAQPYSLVAGAIDAISRQYNLQRTVKAVPQPAAGKKAKR